MVLSIMTSWPYIVVGIIVAIGFIAWMLSMPGLTNIEAGFVLALIVGAIWPISLSSMGLIVLVIRRQDSKL